jgi:hypothetical protein
MDLTESTVVVAKMEVVLGFVKFGFSGRRWEKVSGTLAPTPIQVERMNPRDYNLT